QLDQPAAQRLETPVLALDGRRRREELARPRDPSSCSRTLRLRQHLSQLVAHGTYVQYTNKADAASMNHLVTDRSRNESSIYSGVTPAAPTIECGPMNMLHVK